MIRECDDIGVPRLAAQVVKADFMLRGNPANNRFPSVGM
jgi:hypothetical protein